MHDIRIVRACLFVRVGGATECGCYCTPATVRMQCTFCLARRVSRIQTRWRPNWKRQCVRCIYCCECRVLSPIIRCCLGWEHAAGRRCDMRVRIRLRISMRYFRYWSVDGSEFTYFTTATGTRNVLCTAANRICSKVHFDCRSVCNEKRTRKIRVRGYISNAIQSQEAFNISNSQHKDTADGAE